MLHIGMIGSEYATARTRLMRDLSGNSGWLAGPPPKAEPASEETPADPAPEINPAAKIPQEAPESAPAEETAD